VSPQPEPAFPSYSQSGEDRIVCFLLELASHRQPLRYVDIGAALPVGHSNTYLFYVLGGRGVLAEADPDYMQQYAALRPNDRAVNVAVVPQRLRAAGTVEFYAMDNPGHSTVLPERASASGSVQRKVQVPCLTIDELFQQYCAVWGVDLLSIDIEGLDLEVLAEMQCRPKIIIAENDAGVRIHEPLMHERGYRTFGFTGVNTIYIDGRVFSF
jgi:FkbM family methyltransferase